MKTIVGLGNPGKKFEKTRHNVGFRAVDEIAANFQFFHFSKKAGFNAEVSEGKIGSEKVILIKPQTFMNESGKAVKTLVAFYKVMELNLIVIHDDIDLPLGKIRISIGRSSAGHKGVESIICELKTKNFIRFRIGIKPPEKEKKTERFVLGKFTKDEEKALKEIIKKTIDAIELIIKEGSEKAMLKYN